MSLRNIWLKIIFFLLFIAVAYYIVFMESEKYESKSIVMIKDLSQKQSTSPLGSLLLASGSEGLRDAKLLEVYIKSHEMYDVLEKEFNLTENYTSDKLDILHRLFLSTEFLWLEANKQNLLKQYNNDLHIVYDEPSSTLEIGFAHMEADVAPKIVQKIVKHAGDTLNIFEKKNTKIILDFLKKQEKEKYELFLFSLEKLLEYQNRHSTIDPKIDIEAKSTIVASLEAELVQKEVEYNSKAQYLNKTSPEMKLLKGNILYIKQSISKIKKQITGEDGKRELNIDLSDFSLLQSEVEFNKELYRQILTKLEETEFSIRQNSKNLIVISEAEIEDSYTYPNKIKDIITIYIILLFMYGILSIIITLIREHKD